MTSRLGRRSGRPRAFSALLLSYLLVLLIPLAVAALLSRGMTDATRRQALDARLRSLERSRDVLDAELRAVDTALIQVAMNSKPFVLLGVTDVLNGPDIVRVIEAWQELGRAAFPPSLVQELYLYFSRSDVILSPSISYVRMDCFDTSFFSCRGRTFSEWKVEALREPLGKRWIPASPMSFGGPAVPVLTQVRALPLGASSPSGAALVFLRVSELERTLRPEGESSQVRVSIVSDDGQLLLGSAAKVATSAAAQAVRAGERWLLSVSSLYSGWSYVVDIPDRLLLEGFDRTRRAFFLGFAGFAIVAGMGVALLARWQTRPIREIMRILGSGASGVAEYRGNEYEQIQGMVSSLLEGNRDLAEAVSLQAPMVRHSFLSRLLRGELADRTEIETLAPQAGVDLASAHYLVLVAVLPSGMRRSGPEVATLSLAREALRRFIERRLPEGAYVVETDVDELSVLICSGGRHGAPRADDCPERARRLAATLSIPAGSDTQPLPHPAGGDGGALPVRPVAGAGTVVDSAMEICLSYANARTAARQACQELGVREGLVWYAELPKGRSTYYYPLSLEGRIVSLAHQGDRTAVEDLLRLVYRENFEERELSAEARIELYRELVATVQKSAEHLRQPSGEGTESEEVRDILLALEGAIREADAQRFFEALRVAFSGLCSGVENRRRGHTRRLREEVLRFVTSSFADPNLCLQSVASRFRLNEFYVSQFFKEQTGENFHQYLERLRLGAACRLLSTTELPIHEIARSVGYASPGTFRKALRRVTGLAPRDVRQGVAVPIDLVPPEPTR